MRYVFAFILPPLAVGLCRRWGHFTVNLIVWLTSFPLLMLIVPGIVVWAISVAHAIAVCRMWSIDKRVNRLVQAIEQRPAAASAEPQ